MVDYNKGVDGMYTVVVTPKREYKLHEFTDKKGNKGTSAVSDSGRHYVSVLLPGGGQQPFYLSSGLGNKKKVKAGKWYPFFGQGKHGWINKGSEEQINDYYGVPAFKNIAEQLDASTDVIKERSLSKYEIPDFVDIINRGQLGVDLEASKIDGFPNVAPEGFAESLEQHVKSIRDAVKAALV